MEICNVLKFSNKNKRNKIIKKTKSKTLASKENIIDKNPEKE